MIDELDRRSISGALDAKLARLGRGEGGVEMTTGQKLNTKKGRERSNSTPNFIKTARRQIPAGEKGEGPKKMKMPWNKGEGGASGATQEAQNRKDNRASGASGLKSTYSKKSKFSVISGITNKSSVMRETTALRKFAARERNQDAEEYEKDREVNSSVPARPEGAGDGLQYKDMKDIYYYSSTILLFLLEAGIACLVPSVDVVMNFLSAIAVMMLGFGFPSLFFIFADKYYGKFKQRSSVVHKFLEQENQDDSGDAPMTESRYGFIKKMAWFHVVLAIAVFLVCFVAGILNILHSGGE